MEEAFDPLRTKGKERYDYLDCENRRIPKVCFTSISQSNVVDTNIHRGKYGQCCIGLTQSWGKEKQLNPIIYCRKNSLLTNILKPIVAQYPELLNFCKQYSDAGDQCSEEMKRELRRFDEREWRYIPQDQDYSSKLSFGPRDVKYIYVENEEQKEELRKICKKYIRKIKVHPNNKSK